MNAGTAYARWLPVLESWGLKISSNTCTSTTLGAGLPCIVQGTHGERAVTVLFKAHYTGEYAPDAVKARTDAIRTEALNDAASTGSSSQAAQIMDAAKARIASIEADARHWNAAHPATTVNVVIQDQ